MKRRLIESTTNHNRLNRQHDFSIAATFGVALATTMTTPELTADIVEITWNGGNSVASAPFDVGSKALPISQDIDQIEGPYSFAQFNDQLLGTGRTIILFSSMAPPGIVSITEVSAGQRIDPNTFTGLGAGGGTQFDNTGSAFVGFRSFDNNVGWFRLSYEQAGPIIYSQGQYGNNGEAVFANGEPALVGDVNCDGLINLLDVAPFVELLTTGQYNIKADINSDQIVDLLDSDHLVELIIENNR